MGREFRNCSFLPLTRKRINKMNSATKSNFRVEFVYYYQSGVRI